MSVVIQSEDDRELKTAFAEALLKSPDDPFKAAFSICADVGKALQMANLWVSDSFVASEKLRLLEEKGERAFLPTKEDQAKEIYKMANDSKIDEDIRLKAHELYAKIMGYIEKPVPGNTTNILAQNVMLVKDKGDDNEWESGAIEQQRRLVSHAAN